MLNAKQAAAALGVSRRTVLRWIQEGRMKAEKLGDGLTSSYMVTDEEIIRMKEEAAS